MTAAAGGPAVVVLTGGGGGMANACVRRFGGEGHRFLLLDNAEDRLERALTGLGDDGFEVDGLVSDVSDFDSLREAAARAGEIGPLAALVHTAGLSAPMADSRRLFEVNLIGTANLLDAFEPNVVAGSVAVCVASIGGHRGFARNFDRQLSEPRDPRFLDRLEEAGLLAVDQRRAYALSKRGVIILCRRRALDWGERGGRVVSISPGLIADTAIGEVAAGGAAGAYVEQSAVGRAGSADDVAELVAFLASPAASFITGCDVLIDGGVYAAVECRYDEDSRREWHRE